MKTLKDAVEAKQKLERDVLALVKTFEDEYDLSVGSIYNSLTHTIGDVNPKTEGIRVVVEV